MIEAVVMKRIEEGTGINTKGKKIDQDPGKDHITPLLTGSGSRHTSQQHFGQALSTLAC